MSVKLRPVLLALAAVLVAGAAQAQPGREDVSPELRAARQAARQACAADAKTYCDGQTGHDRMACMRQNADKLSDPCRAALADLMARRPAPPGT